VTPVFEGDHLRLLWSRERPGDRLFVTFDHWRKGGRNGFETPGGNTLFDTRGWPVLRVQTARNDWFLNPDLEAALDIVAAIASEYESAVTYGFSMGGYGALRFARAAGAARVVTISPQFSPVAARVPFEARWWQDRKRCDPGLDDLSHLARPDAPPVVAVYDPLQGPDRLHADLIRGACARFFALPLPFGGHPATQTIQQGDRLGSFAAALLTGPLDRAALIAPHKRARRKAEHYARAIARAADRRANRPGAGDTGL
jgi:hypothetical protein